MEKKATSTLSGVKIRDRIAKKLGNLATRRRFFRLRAQEEVAQQIREFRERRRFRQIDLAREAKMKQSAISRIEKASYSAWTYKTLLRIAEALDAQLRIVFEAHEDVIARYEQEFANQAETPINQAALLNSSRAVDGQMVSSQPALASSGGSLIPIGSTFGASLIQGLTPDIYPIAADASVKSINQFVAEPYGVSPAQHQLRPVQKYAQAREREYPI